MAMSAFDQFERPACPESGERFQVVIQPVHGHVQMEIRYKSIVTGDEITTWKDRKEEFAANNLVDVSDTDWSKVTDDIGKPPKWARPITNKKGEVISDPMVGTFNKSGQKPVSDEDLAL